MPSLQQLSDAVEAYITEHPDHLITVVVDATFGHRIDPSEIPEFDAAIEHNELVAPPAGAIGRGDGFVLAIADKVDAIILTNDSFQEFHGQYDWLFDEGRLVGGKPVPHIGWVFVPRVPVRGPISRKSQREAKRPARGEVASTVRTSVAPNQPMPIPKAPPPKSSVSRPASGRGGRPSSDAGTETRRSAATADVSRSTVDRPAVDRTAVERPAATVPARNAMVNDLFPFLEFVEKHPMGSLIDSVVETYSSHGAYVLAGGARAYLPLRNIADPAPRGARELYKIGETVSLQVAAFHPQRRGIDVAVPGVVVGLEIPAAAPAKRGRRKAEPVVAPAVVEHAPAVATSAPVSDGEARSSHSTEFGQSATEVAPTKPGRGRTKAARSTETPAIAPEAAAAVKAMTGRRGSKRSTGAVAAGDVVVGAGSLAATSSATSMDEPTLAPASSSGAGVNEPMPSAPTTPKGRAARSQSDAKADAPKPRRRTGSADPATPVTVSAGAGDFDVPAPAPAKRRVGSRPAAASSSKVDSPAALSKVAAPSAPVEAAAPAAVAESGKAIVSAKKSPSRRKPPSPVVDETVSDRARARRKPKHD